MQSPQAPLSAMSRFSALPDNHPARSPAPRANAAAQFATLPPAAAAQTPVRLANGGPVRGPGTGTSDDVPDEVPPGTYIMPADSTAVLGEEQLNQMGAAGDGMQQPATAQARFASVPVQLSNGEYKLTPEQVHAIGVQTLDALKDATHEPVEQGAPVGDFFAQMIQPRQAFADGGDVQDPQRSGNVTRVGNSYSGGNVGGSIAVNGQAPRGTVSIAEPFRQSAAPAPATPAAPPSANPLAAMPPAAAPSPEAQPPASPAMGGLSVIGHSPTQDVRSAFTQRLPALSQGGGGVAPPPPLPADVPPPLPAFQRPPGVLEQMAAGQIDTGPSMLPPILPPIGAAPRVMPSTGWSTRGYEPRQYADGGLVRADDEARRLAAARLAAPPGTDMIGRGGERFMGMAQEVPRTALPPAAVPVPAPAAGPNPLAARTGIMEAPQAAGHRTVHMGMVDEVPRTQLQGPPASPPGAAPASGAAARFSRLAGPAAGAVGAAMEGKQVYDVARDPQSTGLDVAAQAAQGVARLSSAGAGAAGGAALGAMTGPFAPVGVPAGALIGGALGYLGADKAIEAGRELTGSNPRSPAEQAFARLPGSGGGGPLSRASAAVPANPLAVMPGAGGGRGFVNPPAADPNAPHPFAQVPAGAYSRTGNSFSDGSAMPGDMPAAQRLAFGVRSAPIGYIGAEGVTSADRVAQMQRDTAHIRDMAGRQWQQEIDSGRAMAPGLAFIPDGDAARREARNASVGSNLGSPNPGALAAVRSLRAERDDRADARQRLSDLSNWQAAAMRDETARRGQDMDARQRFTDMSMQQARFGRQDGQFAQTHALAKEKLELDREKAAKAADGKTLNNTAFKSLTEARDGANTATRLLQSFKPEYGKQGFLGLGGDASLAVKGVFGRDKDTVQWWKNYRRDSELVERNALFGAALTEHEQKSWQNATISPGMDDDVIRRNLATREALARKVLGNTQQDLIDAGHSARQVNAIASRGPAAVADAEPQQAGQPAPAGPADQSHAPTLSELQKRAATNPALAQRLREWGY